MAEGAGPQLNRGCSSCKMMYIAVQGHKTSYTTIQKLCRLVNTCSRVLVVLKLFMSLLGFYKFIQYCARVAKDSTMAVQYDIVKGLPMTVCWLYKLVHGYTRIAIACTCLKVLQG